MSAKERASWTAGSDRENELTCDDEPLPRESRASLPCGRSSRAKESKISILKETIRRVRHRERLRDREGVVRRSVRHFKSTVSWRARDCIEKMERTSFASCDTRGL